MLLCYKMLFLIISQIWYFNDVSNKATHFHSRRISDAMLCLTLNANLLIKVVLSKLTR